MRLTSIKFCTVFSIILQLPYLATKVTATEELFLDPIYVSLFGSTPDPPSQDTIKTIENSVPIEMLQLRYAHSVYNPIAIVLSANAQNSLFNQTSTDANNLEYGWSIVLSGNLTFEDAYPRYTQTNRIVFDILNQTLPQLLFPEYSMVKVSMTVPKPAPAPSTTIGRWNVASDVPSTAPTIIRRDVSTSSEPTIKRRDFSPVVLIDKTSTPPTTAQTSNLATSKITSLPPVAAFVTKNTPSTIPSYSESSNEPTIGRGDVSPVVLLDESTATHITTATVTINPTPSPTPPPKAGITASSYSSSEESEEDKFNKIVIIAILIVTLIVVLIVALSLSISFFALRLVKPLQYRLLLNPSLERKDHDNDSGPTILFPTPSHSSNDNTLLSRGSIKYFDFKDLELANGIESSMSSSSSYSIPLIFIGEVPSSLTHSQSDPSSVDKQQKNGGVSSTPATNNKQLKRQQQQQDQQHQQHTAHVIEEVELVLKPSTANGASNHISSYPQWS